MVLADGTGIVCVGKDGTAPDARVLGIISNSSSLHQESEGSDISLQPKINSVIRQGEGMSRVLAFF